MGGPLALLRPGNGVVAAAAVAAGAIAAVGRPALDGPLLVNVALGAVAALAGLMLAYEWKLKALGAPGNVAIGILSGATFAFGGLAVGNPMPTLPLAALGILASIGREIAKDIEDMAADEGRRTLPQRIGAPKAGLASAAATVCAVALSPLPFFPLALLGLVYLAAIAAADATFIYAAAVVRASPSRSQQLSKAGMGLATLAFALGGWFR